MIKLKKNNDEELVKKITDLGLSGTLKGSLHDLEFTNKRIDGYSKMLSELEKPFALNKKKMERYNKQKKLFEDMLDKLYKEKDDLTEEISKLYEELLESNNTNS